MCLPLQDGQTPRPLQENATTNPWPQPVHSARAKPKQSSPAQNFLYPYRAGYTGTAIQTQLFVMF